jgi:hypothetical protein
MNMKNRIYLLNLIIIFFCISCNDVLDKRSLSNLSDDEVWSDSKLADGYMAKIALDNSPVWANTERNCDEADAGTNSAVSYGIVTSSDLQGLAYWPYNNIRNINFLLEKLTTSTLSEAQIASLQGQAHFWRAYVYFEMVKRYGGVPIIKEVQKLEDDLMVVRNKTSVCFDFIIDELNQSIALLPLKFSGNDVGKINQAVAYALKGRVLLYKASPQFNPSGNASLWNDAYNANKIAYETLGGNGYALYEKFGNFWFDELNKEVVFVTRFNDPERVTGAIKARRPNSESVGISAAGGGSPTQELVDRFPMIDGKSIVGNPQYDPNNYWKNRDPRFDATIVYNGKLWELSRKTGRIQWTYYGFTPDGMGTPFGTITGYFTNKAVELAPDAGTATNGTVDWVEIRFAEVMMNYAEAANETGHTDVAYDMLKLIRKRAGITAGIDNMYGLTAGQDKAGMRETLMNERFIEFAYEGKRFWDLRRMRWLDRLTGIRRHGLQSTPRDKTDLSKGFTFAIVIVDTKQAMSMPDNYYFLPMSKTELEKNPNLKQTNGWDAGGFDPLQ